jgi:hypothetical protein
VDGKANWLIKRVVHVTLYTLESRYHIHQLEVIRTPRSAKVFSPSHDGKDVRSAFNSPYYVYVVRFCYGHVSRTNVQPL